MSIKKTILLNRYFDYYEKLLTEKQREVFIYYYQDDLSYQEIADILKISRSAVYDALKRTCAFLESTEEKLGFVRRMDELYEKLYALNNEEVNKILSEID